MVHGELFPMVFPSFCPFIWPFSMFSEVALGPSESLVFGMCIHVVAVRISTGCFSWAALTVGQIQRHGYGAELVAVRPITELTRFIGSPTVQCAVLSHGATMLGSAVQDGDTVQSDRRIGQILESALSCTQLALVVCAPADHLSLVRHGAAVLITTGHPDDGFGQK